MKIDYRALAEKLNALSERLVDSEEHAVEAAIPPIAEEAAEALCTLVSLLKGMADQEPIAWMYEHDGCMDTPIITIKRWAKCEEPWNESPLVPHPAPQPQSEPTEAQHADDAAVDRFAAAMKAKLAEKRAEGRGGWDDPEQCSTTYLAMLLRGHVEKGDPLDVGNFAMMLWNRGGATNEAIDVGIPDLRLTEAQFEATAKWLNENLPAHGPAYFSRRALATGALRAALATKETK